MKLFVYVDKDGDVAFASADVFQTQDYTITCAGIDLEPMPTVQDIQQYVASERFAIEARMAPAFDPAVPTFYEFKFLFSVE